MEYVGYFADFLGIVSFFLTIILLIKSERIRNELIFQKTNYKSDHNKIRRNLITLKDAWIDNTDMSYRFKSELRVALYEYLQNFDKILTRQDKKKINKILSILNSQEHIASNHPEFGDCLDYLIARFSKREDSI